MKGAAIVTRVVRLILRARYRIRLEGSLPPSRDKGGWLILPSHPTYLDPFVATVALWRGLQPRPVYEREMVEHPLIRWLPRTFHGIPLPDLTQPSQTARAETVRAIDAIVAALEAGENVLLWPAGRAQRSGRESLRDTWGAAEILSRAPDAGLIRVRARGLWGSRFSYAFHGRAPRPARQLLEGALAGLLSLAVFLPRRRVVLTVEAPPRSAWPPLEPRSLNEWLESFYNSPTAEEPTFVPIHALVGPRSHVFPPVLGAPTPDAAEIAPEIRAGVADLIAAASETPIDRGSLTGQRRLEALGLDSLARMDLTIAVEKRFGHSVSAVPETVGALWLQASGQGEPTLRAPVPAACFRPDSGESMELE